MAAAEPLLPIAPEPPAEPLVLAATPLDDGVPLEPLPMPDELLPLMPDEEPEPAAADLSFGWPVA